MENVIIAYVILQALFVSARVFGLVSCSWIWAFMPTFTLIAAIIIFSVIGLTSVFAAAFWRWRMERRRDKQRKEGRR